MMIMQARGGLRCVLRRNAAQSTADCSRRKKSRPTARGRKKTEMVKRRDVGKPEAATSPSLEEPAVKRGRKAK
jgi:hypothetical protein